MKITKSAQCSPVIKMRLLFVASLLPWMIQAIRLLESKSLSACMPNSAIAATYLHAIYTPDNETLEFHVDGDSQVASNVTIEVNVLGYGYNVFSQTISPCDYPSLKSICPMIAGPLPDLQSNLQIPQEQAQRVPNIVYYIPDLDGKIVAWFNSSATGEPIACVECELSNGKTVYQTGAAWSIGILTVICLASSAVLWCKGHVATSGHLAAKTWCLISYFQAVACIGMASVRLPPIVRAWTQNFQWSMGIMRLGFLQGIATWYLRATGGQLTTLLTQNPSSLSSVSIQKRTNVATGTAFTMSEVTVRGIERVSYVASIEISNFFMTGYMWFLIFVAALIIAVTATKLICIYIAKRKSTASEKWEGPKDFWSRNMKGILFRFIFFSFLPMIILCVHELVRRDSVAECFLAVFTILGILHSLGRGTYFTIKLRQQSLKEHGNAAYLLYSNDCITNHWGFLFTPYKATHSWFLVPTLAYFLVKGAFIGGSQDHSMVLALAVAVLDVLYLVATAVFRPYVDKGLNVTNIAVCTVNVLNAGLLLEFSSVFKKPPLATGVSGIVFFFINLPFVALLLIFTFITAIRYLFFSKNPDCKFAAHFKDDRNSFMPSQFPFAFRKVPSKSAVTGYNSSCDRQKWRNASEEAILNYPIGISSTVHKSSSGSAASSSKFDVARPSGMQRKHSTRPPTMEICPELVALGNAARSAGSVSRTTSDSVLKRNHRRVPEAPGSSGTNISRSSDALPLNEIAIALELGATSIHKSGHSSRETSSFVDSQSQNSSGSSVGFASSSGSISPIRGIATRNVGSTELQHRLQVPVNDLDEIEEFSPCNTVHMDFHERRENIHNASHRNYTNVSCQMLHENTVMKENHEWPVIDWILPTDRGKAKVKDKSEGNIMDVNRLSSRAVTLRNDSGTVSEAIWSSPSAKHEMMARRVMRKGGEQPGVERGGYEIPLA